MQHRPVWLKLRECGLTYLDLNEMWGLLIKVKNCNCISLLVSYKFYHQYFGKWIGINNSIMTMIYGAQTNDAIREQIINFDVQFSSNFLHFNLIVPYWPNFPHSFCYKFNSQPIFSSIDENFQPIYCRLSEAGDCSHPPPKMAMAENLTSGKAAFDFIAEHGSLRFLACKQVLDRANLLYNNKPTTRQSGLTEHSHFPAGSSWLHRKRQVIEGSQARDSHFSLNFRELVLRGHVDSSAVENS